MGHVAEQAGHLGDQFSEVTALGQAKAVASHRTPNLLWGAFGARPEQAFQLGADMRAAWSTAAASPGSAGSRTKGFLRFADGRLQGGKIGFTAGFLRAAKSRDADGRKRTSESW